MRCSFLGPVWESTAGNTACGACWTPVRIRAAPPNFRYLYRASLVKKYFLILFLLSGFLLVGCRSTPLERIADESCKRIDGQSLIFSSYTLYDRISRAEERGYTKKEFLLSMLNRCPNVVLNFMEDHMNKSSLYSYSFSLVGLVKEGYRG